MIFPASNAFEKLREDFEILVRFHFVFTVAITAYERHRVEAGKLVSTISEDLVRHTGGYQLSSHNYRCLR